MLQRRSILVACLCLASVSFAGTVFAQKETPVDLTQLQYYETQFLKGGRNATLYTERITAERQRIRTQLAKEVEALVQPSENSQDLEPSKAIDRQRQIVDDLTGRLNESTVDLNLLKDEESVYKSPLTGSAATAGRFMLTKSYPELLARKVMLEENIDLLSTALSAQQKRLNQLLSEQRAANVGAFLVILWYLLVIFLVLLVEHFVRTQLILRIPHRRLRYALAKLFSILFYFSLFFWLIQRIVMSYPSLVTVFAVIGAALVFMLQDPIKSFLGWLTHRGALTLGHRVTLGGYTGDVLDIGVFFTSILVSRSPTLEDSSQAGKIVRIPNSNLLTGNLLNYHSTSDFENVEIPVHIAEPRQWERAYAILEEILQEETGGFSHQAQRQMDRRMRGFYFSQVSPSTRIYMELTEKRELTLLLCFPAPIGHRRATTTRILQRVLERFDKENIRLANPA